MDHIIIHEHSMDELAIHHNNVNTGNGYHPARPKKMFVYRLQQAKATAVEAAPSPQTQRKTPADLLRFAL